MKLDDKTRTEPVDVEPGGAEVVTCPATGEVVGSVPMTPRAEVEAVAARLRAAQADWQAMGATGRARWMGRWRDWIFDHSDELIGLMQQESGKSWGDANIEVFGTDMMNYWAEHAAKFLADENVRPVGPANMAKKLTVCTNRTRSSV
jgi:acyl-CoA reductase-like NAD-dependent aldehyde dehydrogenase